jgi:hypothetical protein
MRNEWSPPKHPAVIHLTVVEGGCLSGRMNNNFDELILKRRACGRARTASMGMHVSWGTNVHRVARGRGATTATGRARSRDTYVRAPRWRRVWGAHGCEPRGWWGRNRTCPPMGAHTCAPPIQGASGRARPRATWLVGRKRMHPQMGARTSQVRRV